MPTDSREPPAVGPALTDLYTVERVIAQGGMADVYLATDLRHQRKVAIKVMRRETMGPQDRQRFTREISIAANLSHPNIVPLFDSGQAGSLMYYVMPLVNGPSLREHLAERGRLPVDEALAITFEVADALAFAHRRGVVHRDIKPGNILLEAGHARVADFGVAKAMEAAGPDALTSGQFAVGTLAYMSPEQASTPQKTDGRSDLYSLAVVLYEMLTGELPFDGATPDAALAAKVISGVRPVREFTGVPTHVDAALRRALVPNPDDRFATIEEFVAALRGERTRGPRVWASVLRWSTKRRKAIAAVTVLGVGGVAAIVALAGANSRALASAPKLGRIVVVPFVNNTDDSTFDPVSREIADWVTEGLFNTHILEVAPPLHVVGGGSSELSTRRVAEETDAGTVVEGSFDRVGDSLVFRARISDQGGRRVASEITEVRAPVRNPQSGIKELRSRVMGALAVKYDERAVTDAQPPTYEAYRAFDEGLTLYNASQYRDATRALLYAYDLDSTFTRALLYASMAMTNNEQWAAADSLLQLVDRRRDELDEYHRALLDARMAFVHGNSGMHMAAIRQAAALAPRSKAVYNLAVAAFQYGYVNEALSAIETLQPDQAAMKGFTGYWSIYASIVHALKDYERELGLGIAARREFPGQLIAFVPQVRALAAKGNITDLEFALAEARQLPAGPYYWDLGRVLDEVATELYVHGHPVEARGYWQELDAWLAVRDTAIREPTDRIGWRRVQAFYALQRWSDAEQRLSNLRNRDPRNTAYLGMAGMLRARGGDRVMAAAIADTLAQRQAPYEFGRPQAYRARIEAILGEKDLAVAALRQSFAEGGPYQAWIHKDINLYDLRSYQPFRRLIDERK